MIVILNRKILFVLLIVLVIGTVSHASAHDLENATLADDVVVNDLPVYDDVRFVGGNCDFIDEQLPSSMNATITVIFIENKTPTPAEIQLSQSWSYFGDKTLTVKVVDNNGTALYCIPVDLKFSNGKTATVITQKNGKATYKLPFNPGTYSVNAKVTSNVLNVSDAKLNNIKIKSAQATIALKKLSTSYGARKYFQIEVTNSKTKKGIGGVKLLVKVYTNGKAKNIRITTNSKGIAKFSTADLDVGNHEVKVSEISPGVNAKAKTGQIKVGKAPTTFLDEVGAVFIKKGGVYNIALFNKNNEKVIKGIKLTVKIFTDEKIITYVVKTGKYGSDIDLSYLGLGTYKVVVSFDGNSRYQKCTGRDYIDVIRSSGCILFA